MSRIIGQSSSSSQSNLSTLGKLLLKAAEFGNSEDVRVLLAQGAPFTADWLGMSALHYACINGHCDTAQILMRAGVSWDGRSKVDKTPLHFASQYGHLEVVQALCSFGANVNAKDMLLMTPLHWAVVEQHLHVVKFLAERNAELTDRNKFDKSPLESAEDVGHFQMVEYLKSVLHTDPLLSMEEVRSPPSNSNQDQSSGTILSSLASLSTPSVADQLPWLQNELLNQNASSGSTVLLEGANLITLTEAGKLALQLWSNASKQDEQRKETDKANDMVLNNPTQDGEQKLLSITLANQILDTPSSSEQSTNQPLTLVLSPKKSKASNFKSSPNKRKRQPQPHILKKSDVITSRPSKEDLLQRQLLAVQSEVERYREKLVEKEKEADLYKKTLELLQQQRT